MKENAAARLTEKIMEKLHNMRRRARYALYVRVYKF